MPIHVQYTKELLEQLNYVATWLPTVGLKPGDVCDMRGYELRKVGALQDFSIPFVLEDQPVEADIEYSSAESVSIQFKLSGEPPPTGSLLAIEDAGINLSFSRAAAVLLRLAGCSSKRIANLHEVGKKVLEIHLKGDWPKGYVVVAEALQAGVSTIIISDGVDAGIDLMAKASAGAPVGRADLKLTSIDASLSVKRESKIGAKFVAMPGLTPLVRVSGIKKRVLRPDEFRSGQQSSEAGFSSVFYDDYKAG